MAAVPKGPGQSEVTGDLRDPRDAMPLGTWKDPESGAELEVTMGAGADALARMGWQHTRALGKDAPVPPARSAIGHPEPDTAPQAVPSASEPQAQEASAPEPAAKLDDADQVEDQQDNAAGHKQEGVDGAPGVPAGDPQDLADEAKSDSSKSDK